MFEQRLLAVDRRERGPERGAPSTAASDAPSGAAVTGTIVIDGSSTVLPISEAAAEDFNAANPGVDLSVKESGTGGGFTKFCAGETDINDASRPIKEDDAKEGTACKANNVTYVQLQVAIDGLTVVVNPANTFATCMTLEQLKTIYGPDSPENLTWNQVDPSLAEPAGRPLHARRRLGDLRLLHRGRQRRGRRVDHACPAVRGRQRPRVDRRGRSQRDQLLRLRVLPAEQHQGQGRRRSTAARAASSRRRRPSATGRTRRSAGHCSSIRTPPRPRSRRPSTSSSTSTWPMPPPWRPSRPSAMWRSRTTSPRSRWPTGTLPSRSNAASLLLATHRPSSEWPVRRRLPATALG